MLRSFELLMWVNRLPEEYALEAEQEDLLEKIYYFCIDNNFHENPLYQDYQEQMDAISQANISLEHNLMQEHEENIIESQEEECMKNDDPEEHEDKGWNGHCPETPTDGFLKYTNRVTCHLRSYMINMGI